jgi:hypothetical protein
LHFVTAKEYFTTYQKIEVRPNAAICRILCLGQIREQEAFQPEDRGEKDQILSDLMSVRAVVSPDLGVLAFHKQNKEAQAHQLVKRGTESLVNATGNKLSPAAVNNLI